MNMFMVDLHGNLRTARSHIDVESRDAVGSHQRCVVFLKEQQIAFLQVVQVVQSGFDIAHRDLQFQFRVAYSCSQIAAPFAVRLFITFTARYAAAEQLAHRLQGGVGVNQIDESASTAGRCIGFKAT